MKSTYKTLEYVAEKRLIKEYATFLKLKGMFSNSCIFEPKKINTLLDCSRTKANRITFTILKQNWGHMKDGHLILKSAKEIHTTLFGYVPKHYIEIKNVEDIYIELLKQKQSQKEFIKTKVNDLNSNASTMREKKCALKILGGERAYVDNGMSLSVISKSFGLSIRQSGNIIKHLNSCGLIEVEKRTQSFGAYNSFLFKNLNEKYMNKVFVSGNIMKKNLTSKITILAL